MTYSPASAPEHFPPRVAATSRKADCPLRAPRANAPGPPAVKTPEANPPEVCAPPHWPLPWSSGIDHSASTQNIPRNVLRESTAQTPGTIRDASHNRSDFPWRRAPTATPANYDSPAHTARPPPLPETTPQFFPPAAVAPLHRVCARPDRTNDTRPCNCPAPS